MSENLSPQKQEWPGFFLSGPEVIKTFFMLNSAGHEILNAPK